VKESPEIAKFVAKYQKLSDKKFKKKAFEIGVVFDPSVAKVRYSEGALTNWVCDICSEDYSLQPGDQKADLCLLLGGTFDGKTALNPGDLMLGDIFGIFPEPILLIVVELSGENIVKSLKLGANTLPKESYGLHHDSSNVKYKIDVTPKKDNPQNDVIISDVLVDGSPIDPAKLYQVAITDKMGIGGFGFTWFKEARRILSEEHASQLQDIVLMYCKRHFNEAGFFPANPVMGRITITQ